MKSNPTKNIPFWIVCPELTNPEPFTTVSDFFTWSLYLVYKNIRLDHYFVRFMSRGADFRYLVYKSLHIFSKSHSARQTTPFSNLRAKIHAFWRTIHMPYYNAAAKIYTYLIRISYNQLIVIFSMSWQLINNPYFFHFVVFIFSLRWAYSIKWRSGVLVSSHHRYPYAKQ